MRRKPRHDLRALSGHFRRLGLPRGVHMECLKKPSLSPASQAEKPVQ